MTVPHRLSTMFAPRTIALVGASEKSVWSHLIMRNYADLAFDGRLFAVNRTGADVLGVKGYSSCTQIGVPVDVAFIFVPQNAVIEAMEDAARAGIRNVAVLSSGFAEIGDEGRRDQDRLTARATELGVNLWGPNSLGYNNISAQVPVSVIPVAMPILPGSIAIVSQSGATASELTDFAHSQNIGTSFVAATGNEADVTLSEVIDYLVDHEPTRAIAVFAEAVRDPHVFEAAANRARAAAKPVVILKVGRGALATAVAQAHTGSLAGDDRVFGAVCERLGVIRVDTPEQLITVAGMLAATGPLPAPGLGFVAISGGACTLVADSAEADGVAMPPNDADTIAALRGVLPPFASTLNPLDMTGAAVRETELFERVIPIAARSPSIGLVAVGMPIPTEPGKGLPPVFASIGRAVRSLDKPVIMVATCRKTLNDITRTAIADHGLPHIITGIDAMTYAVGKAAWWSKQLGHRPRAMLIDQPAVGDARRPLGERAMLDFLATRGVRVIPGTIARTGQDAATFASAMSEPLALKIASQNIAHKTEVGGVRLNVDPDDASAVFDDIMAVVRGHRPDAAIDGIILSPMRSGGVELLVGVTRDSTWGLMLTVAIGGVLVELLTDAVTAPLPVGPGNIVEMLGRLKGAKLLQGFRGAAAADLNAIGDAIARICDAAIALGPDLRALEINPLLVRGDVVEALDALAIWHG